MLCASSIQQPRRVQLRPTLRSTVTTLLAKSSGLARTGASSIGSPSAISSPKRLCVPEAALATGALATGALAAGPPALAGGSAAGAGVGDAWHAVATTSGRSKERRIARSVAWSGRERSWVARRRPLRSSTDEPRRVWQGGRTRNRALATGAAALDPPHTSDRDMSATNGIV